MILFDSLTLKKEIVKICFAILHVQQVYVNIVKLIIH